jgi:hypothetical protein
MTIAMEDYPDLPRLIRVLSSSRHLLHALRVRNILLAPILERGLDGSDPKACWDAWVSHHGPRNMIKVFGELPTTTDNDDTEPLFGILIISNGLRTVDENPAIDLYISHEPLITGSSLEAEVLPPTPESAALLKRMYYEAITPTVTGWNRSRAMCFGINRCWAKLPAKMLYEGNCTRVSKRLDPEEFKVAIQVPTAYRVRQASTADCVTVSIRQHSHIVIKCSDGAGVDLDTGS